MADNLSVEILRTVHRNPYISPVLLHNKLTSKAQLSTVETVLRVLRELKLVQTPSRGNYQITKKGVEVLHNSSQEATE